MNDYKLITKYFENLTLLQTHQYQQLEELYNYWNAQINVVSRKDIEELYLKHVLHSLAIAKVINFTDGSKVLDVGTGGGFPGLPLAIMFPNVQFHLVDSIGKKIKVVQEIATAIGLNNLTATHQRAEEIKEKFDFVVSRAVTRISPFYEWVKNKFLIKNQNSLPNGILYLKGGDVTEEFAELGKPYSTYELGSYFNEDFFETKKLIHIKVI